MCYFGRGYAGPTRGIGDSPQADVTGANQAGMISVLKDPTGRYDSDTVGADHRICRITELRDIVAGYASGN